MLVRTKLARQLRNPAAQRSEAHLVYCTPHIDRRMQSNPAQTRLMFHNIVTSKHYAVSKVFTLIKERYFLENTYLYYGVGTRTYVRNLLHLLIPLLSLFFLLADLPTTILRYMDNEGLMHTYPPFPPSPSPSPSFSLGPAEYLYQPLLMWSPLDQTLTPRGRIQLTTLVQSTLT